MKKLAIALGLVLCVGVGLLLFFFYRMGTNDSKALTDFPAAYHIYDQAITAYSDAVMTPKSESALAPDDLRQKANGALVELRTKSSVRISSLTRNDGDLMQQMKQIADLSAKEYDALNAYQQAVISKRPGLIQLAKEFADLRTHRTAAFKRYSDLAAVN